MELFSKGGRGEKSAKPDKGGLCSEALGYGTKRGLLYN